MEHRYYTGKAGAPRTPLSQRPKPAYELHRAGGYSASPELTAAANVAILLGQPLLLTGEPGTGKTRFAYALAKALELGPVLECFVKSSTSARDLFYSFDELARFRDSQAGQAQPMQSYLSFNGLGRAILFAGGPRHQLERLPGFAFDTAIVVQGQAKVESEATAEQPPSAGETPRRAAPTRPQVFADLFPASEFPSDPVPSVVLIDELDKAPRDTPNDLLNEIERLGFDIPELGVRVKVPDEAKVRPIIVITSNSEKSLPEPFLRRCVYFDIPFPAGALREIVHAQVKGLGDEPSTLLQEALALFDRLRNRNRIQRPPGTAELLAWLDALLASGLAPGDSLRVALSSGTDRAVALRECTLAVLAKKLDDRAVARELIGEWVAQAA